MIVNQAQTGWEIIYHRAHALLAAQIAGHWDRKNAPARLYETIAAISHHDDLEKEWEGNHLTDAGAPMDFTLGKNSDETALKMWQKHIENARYRGRWVTLLTSYHLVYLNQDKWEASKEWGQFLKEQVKLQEKWRKELGIDKDEAERAYQFMGWCDRLSLILAQKKIPDAGRALEITSGIDGVRYDLRELPDGKLTVEPWCFEEEFTVNVEAAYLEQLQFKSNEELVQALQSAPVQILEWTFTKDNGKKS
ncbi:MAG: hypothetical protein N5P05_002071 [Chroococcopsis gigantea SAG 12.99]|jgi:hypothetical protein|nr:DUF3891 family protein [Chlorogloea purpurea SAG 13.99]MDV3000465.1 hypothetical protein [Chroococcopsis gigantea SAG 12.99]